jgi:hypothetical protein
MQKEDALAKSIGADQERGQQIVEGTFRRLANT